MTSEKQAFIQMFGLNEKSADEVEERDKKTALRYIMSGSSIPQTLMFRLENYQKRVHSKA